MPQEINVHLTRTNFVLARTYFHDSSMHGEIAVECNFRGTINIFGVLPVDSTLVWNSRERRGKIESLTYDLTVFSDLGPWRVYDEDRSRYDVGYGSKSKKMEKACLSLVAGVIGFGRNRSQSKSWDARTALSMLPPFSIDSFDKNSATYTIQIDSSPDIMQMNFPISVEIPSFALIVAQTGRLDGSQSGSFQRPSSRTG